MRKKIFVSCSLPVIIFICFQMFPSAAAPALIPIDSTLNTETKLALCPARVSVKPNIDGILDEKAWKSPPLEVDFITYKPRFGETLPFKTSVWLAYDNRNLYFAFLCYDPEPQKIRSVITQRDQVPEGNEEADDDWVGVSLDSQGIGQCTFDFYVNPINNQVDDLFTVGKDGHSGEDFSQNFAWESAALKTDQGYQVEICIPLKSIRFQAGKEVIMKILFFRRITRLNIQGSWPAWKNTTDISNYWPVIYKDLEDSSPGSSN